ILDGGWGEVRCQLEYKTDWHGSELLVAPAFYPSTLRCSGCGEVKTKGEMPLEQRTYVCCSCGLVIDRDLNAALNLEQWGREQLEQQRSGQQPDQDSLTSGGPSEEACWRGRETERALDRPEGGPVEAGSRRRSLPRQTGRLDSQSSRVRN